MRPITRIYFKTLFHANGALAVANLGFAAWTLRWEFLLMGAINALCAGWTLRTIDEWD